jgi:hypothetical protein
LKESPPFSEGKTRRKGREYEYFRTQNHFGVCNCSGIEIFWLNLGIKRSDRLVEV